MIVAVKLDGNDHSLGCKDGLGSSPFFPVHPADSGIWEILASPLGETGVKAFIKSSI